MGQEKQVIVNKWYLGWRELMGPGEKSKDEVLKASTKASGAGERVAPLPQYKPPSIWV